MGGERPGARSGAAGLRAGRAAEGSDPEAPRRRNRATAEPRAQRAGPERPRAVRTALAAQARPYLEMRQHSQGCAGTARDAPAPPSAQPLPTAHFRFRSERFRPERFRSRDGPAPGAGGAGGRGLRGPAPGRRGNELRRRQAGCFGNRAVLRARAARSLRRAWASAAQPLSAPAARRGPACPGRFACGRVGTDGDPEPRGSAAAGSGEGRPSRGGGGRAAPCGTFPKSGRCGARTLRAQAPGSWASNAGGQRASPAPDVRVPAGGRGGR